MQDLERVLMLAGICRNGVPSRFSIALLIYREFYGLILFWEVRNDAVSLGSPTFWSHLRPVHSSEWVFRWNSRCGAESGSVGPGRRRKATEESTVSWESRGQHQDTALAKRSPSKKQQDRRS